MVIHGNRVTGGLLRLVAESTWGCEVVALDHSAAEGLASAARTRPDVIILGHQPPILDCLEVLGRLRERDAAKIVVCAGRLTEYLVSKLSRSRFHAVLEEPSICLNELHAAIEQVCAGSRYLSARYQHLSTRLRENPDAFPKLLSQRQEQVLVCVAHQFDDHEIALRLGMTVSTAERHRNDIMRKLNVHKTPRLIRYTVQMGFDEAALPPAIR